MNIQSINSHLDVFERDAGICRYCNEDLLWSYSIFASARLDRLSTTSDGWVTCCAACYRELKECSLESFDQRREFVQQQTRIGIEQHRAIAQKIRPNGKRSSVLARLVQAGVLRNGDVISLDNILPSFLQHPPGDPAYLAIVHCHPNWEQELIYLLDGSLKELGALTFDIFQRGHVSAPYRKTRFSWSVCPYDHWVTQFNVSLTELRVRLDWDDLPSDVERNRLPDVVEEFSGDDDPSLDVAKAVLPDGEEFPVSFLQRRFRIGYSRACTLYEAILSIRSKSSRIS